MTKEQAINAFWNSFGIPACEETSVPLKDDNQTPTFGYPYITYSMVYGSFGTAVASVANIWTRSDSWLQCISLSDDVAAAIGRGGCCRAYDGGVVWIKRGVPFMQNLGDESDEKIKRRYINLEMEFISD